MQERTQFQVNMQKTLPQPMERSQTKPKLQLISSQFSMPISKHRNHKIRWHLRIHKRKRLWLPRML
jgi:hypothetical protein